MTDDTMKAADEAIAAPSYQLRWHLARGTLQEGVRYWGALGYTVTSQTADSAQLVRRKRFSAIWFLAWLVFGLGVGALVYAGYYMSKSDSIVHLWIDPATVQVATSRRG